MRKQLKQVLIASKRQFILQKEKTLMKAELVDFILTVEYVLLSTEM